MERFMNGELVISGGLACIGCIATMYSSIGVAISFIGIGGLFVHALYLVLKEL